MKLHYFHFPGRGDAARLMLALSGRNWEDVRIHFPEWPGLKGKMPFHQVPVLELDDGRMIAQTAAVDRYCASLAGLVPSDPVILATADMYYCFCYDVWAPLGPLLPAAGKLSDEERAARWSQRVEAPLRQRLALLEQHLAKREGKFVAGVELSFADIALFSMLCQFQSGWVKGLPRDILSSYPVLQQFRNQVASLPQVAAYYREQSQKDEALRYGFLPDDEQPAADLTP